QLTQQGAAVQSICPRTGAPPDILCPCSPPRPPSIDRSTFSASAPRRWTSSISCRRILLRRPPSRKCGSPNTSCRAPDRSPRRWRELPPEAIAAARVVHVDDVDINAAIRAATFARRTGTAVTSDIDRVHERTMELVRAVTFPIFAEHVPAALTGRPDPVDAL